MLPKNNKLQKLFFYSSVISLFIAVLSVGWFYKTIAVKLLQAQSAEANILLGRIINNSIQIGIDSKLSPQQLENNQINQIFNFINNKKNHAYLSNIIQNSIEHTPVVKLKIFNLNWKVIYSTEPDNIGKRMAHGYIKELLSDGESFTEIKHHDSYLINNNRLKNVTLLSTYLPMFVANKAQISRPDKLAIFEIYVDVTTRYQSIVDSQWKFVSIITVVLLMLYSVLYFSVRQINMILLKKQLLLDEELQRAGKMNLLLGKNFAKVATKRDRAVKENEAKSRFLANMSHELRTPLNAIIGYSEMISDDARDNIFDRTQEDSNRINDAGKHLLNIINDILDISKVEAGKMELNIEMFDINEMMTEIIATSKLLADKNNNNIVVNLCNSNKKMNSDLTRTRQILLNLISNAIKFTNDGEIRISVSDSLIYGRESIEFIIEDTGIGLDEININKIFQPFKQADLSSTKIYEGTGLGLTISKVFCELMNGEISVTSELGIGSSFSVNIPLNVDFNIIDDVVQYSEFCDLATQDSHSDYCARVLVIDDDPNVRNLLERYLQELNFYVVAVSTGLEGLRVAHNDDIDIIILDVIMPNLNGWSVLQALKRDDKTKHINVVLSSSIDEREIANALGADAYILKPFNREVVEETLCNLVADDKYDASVN